MSEKKGSRSRLPGVDSQECSRLLGDRSGRAKINADLVGLESTTPSQRPRGLESRLRSAGRCRRVGAGEERIVLDIGVGCHCRCWPMRDQACSPRPTFPIPLSLLRFSPLAPSRSSSLVWALWRLPVSSPCLQSCSSAWNY